MKVYGVEIPEALVSSIIEQAPGHTAGELVDYAAAEWKQHSEAPQPDYDVLMRAVDRILQRERKMMRLHFAGGYWHRLD